MIACIIIEDQTPAQHILQRYIANTPGIILKKTFSDAIEAGMFLQGNPVDLVFLDINLPRRSGIEFLKSEPGCPMTILTTAYSEFALESYQYNVVDYLLKPFSFERFSQAIDKVSGLMGQRKAIQESDSNKYVYIKTSYDLVRVISDDIIFIKSDSDYTEVVTSSGKYLTLESLKEWMTRLSDDFRQVHKSYIVNVAHLRKIAQNKVYLSYDKVVPIGRSFKKHFIETVVE